MARNSFSTCSFLSFFFLSSLHLFLASSFFSHHSSFIFPFVFLFLHADTLLPSNAISAINTAMANPKNIAGSFFLKFDYQHRWLAFYSACSKINNSLFTYGDHAIFIKKSCFDSIGGYKPIPFMEDVEILTRLKNYGTFIKLPLGVTTSARRFKKTGVVKQCINDFLLILFYKAGVSPFKLKKYYKDHLAERI